MHFSRIELFQTRCIEHLVIDDIATRGITVIAGKNESGKTTIADAIKAALTIKATSNKQDVKDLRNNSGEPPRIILDMELGGYTFRLDKTFKSKGNLVIDISAPSRKQLVDNEANEWLENLIKSEETSSLWSVFVAQQGQAQRALALGSFAPLTSTLQSETGEAPETRAEVSIFEAAYTEYLKYYSEKSANKRQIIKDAEARVESCQQESVKAKAKVKEFENLNAEADEKDSEIQKLKAEIPVLEIELKSCRTAVENLQKFKQRAAEATENRARAEEKLAAAINAQLARTTLIDAAATAKSRSDEAAEKVKQSIDAAEKEKTEFAEAVDKYEALKKNTREMQRRVNLYTSDLDYFSTVERLSSVEEKMEAADKLNKRQEDLKAKLHHLQVDEKALEVIRNSRNARDTAKAVLDAASPVLEISMLNAESEPVVFVANGEETTLSSAEVSFREAVTDEMNLEIGNAKISVRPGTQTGTPLSNFNSAQEELSTRLAQFGVDSLAEASAQFQEYKKVQSELGECQSQFRITLAGKEYLDLKNEFEAAKVDLSRTSEKRDSLIAEMRQRELAGADSSERPENKEEAKQLLTESAAKLEYTVHNQEQAANLRDQLAGQPKALELARVMAIAEQLKSAFIQRSQELDEARGSTSDESLDDQVVLLSAENRAAKRAEKAAAQELDSQNAADAEFNLTGVQSALELKRSRLRNSENRRSEITGQLRSFESANEILAEAEGALVRASRSYESLMRRANAAKLLYDTLKNARAQTRTAIAEPLLAKMAEYGGSVFGKDTTFEMSEDLMITSRSSDEGTFGHDSLSGGAKEQIDILLRLAAAGVMDGEAGAPVIIDDALGYSDQRRLRSMNNAIAKAGVDNQVLILTCDFDRFQYVGTADYRDMEALKVKEL